jgi:NADPH-dependent ferric siderophore reductase
MLFPTATNPEPVWPIAGPNGLALWPSEERRPVARVYTIRKIDVAAGYMDVDFVVHGDEQAGNEGVGSAWATQAKTGDAVGIIGPLGRPIRSANWYLMGCDETGLPGLGRILERLPAEAQGVAFVEVADAAEEQVIARPAGVELHWIHRNGTAAGDHDALVRTVCAIPWQPGPDSFGWFAAESEAAKAVRQYWRDTLAYGRDQTLVTGYWKRGATGVMAG